MSNQRYESVWDAIEDSLEEAVNMKELSRLMMGLQQHVKSMGWNQARAAEILGITQPRVSDLMRGKISLFDTDALLNMANAAGLTIHAAVA